MDPDILLKLQQYPDYQEGHTVAMPMCAVCKNRDGRGGCKIFGACPSRIMQDYEICDRAILDETAFSYPTYMKLYGYRHKE